MFPLCHIYFTSKVFENISDFAIIGSIYPDIVISEAISRDMSHYNTEELFKYLIHSGKKMEEFAVGALTHGVDMKGLDYYSDENFPRGYKGYCFEKGKIIEENVIECCRIPREWGLWKAHNFIEMAFELYINQRHKDILKTFKKVLEDSNIIRYISQHLEGYYHVSASSLEQSFKNFYKIFEYDQLNELTMMRKYGMQLKKKHGIENIDIEKAGLVISTAVEIISHDADDFFNYTIPKVKKVVEMLGRY